MRALRVVVAGLMLATAVLVGSAPLAAADIASVGFTPMRSGTAERSSIAAVADGDVWVAGKAADGKVRLEHLVRGRWWTTKLPVAADETLQISGSGPRDVWLVSGGQLWHYTLGWRRVALPGTEVATAVVDVAGKDVYVGTYRTAVGDYGSDRIARVFRFDGRTWTARGGPELPDDWRVSGTKKIERLVLSEGQLYAEVRWYPPASVVIWQVYRVVGATWTELARTGQRSGAGYGRSAGWLSYSDQTQVFLGYAESAGPTDLQCTQVTGSSTTDCPLASTAVSAAALLPGGTAVLGGKDWLKLQNGAFVNTPGVFLLRNRDGSETPLGGDPGDATVAMSATPSGGQVWAITVEGDRTSIQRYRR